MLDRTFIAIAIIGTLFFLFKLIRVAQLRSAQRTAAIITMPNVNQILYFSSDACSQCLGQERILNEIFDGSEFLDVILNKYSIEDDVALAQQWGVKTLPTTILLSKFGEVKQINSGLASTTTILTQLRELNINITEQAHK